MRTSYIPQGWNPCGFYYIDFDNTRSGRSYLPLLKVKAHTTILSTSFKTTQTQTFSNPSKEQLKQVSYNFPLYDKVSVVSFTCYVGDRVIRGVVEEKENALRTYNEAVERGETAALLEQSPNSGDVFSSTVGNIPSGATIKVVIEYIGELKHDAETDGIRFTIPLRVMPRYHGTQPSTANDNSNTQYDGGIEIVVDAEMPAGCPIKQIMSTIHPIAVSLGNTSTAPNEEPHTSKASANLSLENCELDQDFVLQIVAKHVGTPKAIVESHPTIPGQRALMATLVPKFTLPPHLVEMIFICDRSGSMHGDSINAAKSALKVFLKSLPIGTKFNICSFGSSHSFLWEKSKTYGQSSLDEATRHVEGFQADYGGTETFRAVKATLESRYKDIPLEVMLLTDGQIQEQQTLFTYLNKEVIDTKAPIRVFTLGIGSSVSTALIEGVARAGNGFSQSVALGEKLDKKVVRMIKGALSPHVKDFRLEVQYAADDLITEDDFEMVDEPAKSEDESVAASTTAKGPPSANTRQKRKSISLFDADVRDDDDHIGYGLKLNKDQVDALPPSVTVPETLQSPYNIPSLFPFNATTVYLLLSPKDANRQIESVTLRGTTSNNEELKLEIPVQVRSVPGKTIHQLAAKNVVNELEEGRGWIYEATDDHGKLLKDIYESRFQDMVKRQAVELGIKYQIGSRWCSWVAVEGNNHATSEQARLSQSALEQPGAQQWSQPGGRRVHALRIPTAQERADQAPYAIPASYSGEFASAFAYPPPPGGPNAATDQLLNSGITLADSSTMQRLASQSVPENFSHQTQKIMQAPASPSNLLAKVLERGERLDTLGGQAGPSNSAMFKSFRARVQGGHNVGDAEQKKKKKASNAGADTVLRFPGQVATAGIPRNAVNPSPLPASSVRNRMMETPAGSGPTSKRYERSSVQVRHRRIVVCDDAEMGQDEVEEDVEDEMDEVKSERSDDRTPLEKIVDFQTFDGHWNANEDLDNVIDCRGVSVDQLLADMKWESNEENNNVAATALVIGFLEVVLKDEFDTWELLAEKGKEWIKAAVGENAADRLIEKVLRLISKV